MLWRYRAKYKKEANIYMLNECFTLQGPFLLIDPDAGIAKLLICLQCLTYLLGL